MTAPHPAERLALVLADENAALAAHDAARAVALLPQKTAALAALTAAPPPGRAVATRLQHLADDNRRLLDLALRVQGEILGLVVQAARSSVAAPVGYRAAPGPCRPPALALRLRA